MGMTQGQKFAHMGYRTTKASDTPRVTRINVLSESSSFIFYVLNDMAHPSWYC